MDTIARIRHFNRYYAERMGFYARNFLDSGLNLTELRVLYEVAHEKGRTAREIATLLEVDEGYLSRVISRFIARGIFSRVASKADGRRKDLRLTPAGEALVADLTARLGDDLNRRLEGVDMTAALQSMEDLERLLSRRSAEDVEIRDLGPGDAGWLIWRHGAIYSKLYGFDMRFEALVAEIMSVFVNEHDPALDRAFIAHRGEERLGSVFCMHSDRPGVAKLRVFWVEPTARGLGLGKRLLDECLGFARAAGYRRIELLTLESQTTARHLYACAGFACDSAAPARMFGADVVEEHWSRDL